MTVVAKRFTLNLSPHVPVTVATVSCGKLDPDGSAVVEGFVVLTSGTVFSDLQLRIVTARHSDGFHVGDITYSIVNLFDTSYLFFSIDSSSAVANTDYDVILTLSTSSSQGNACTGYAHGNLGLIEPPSSFPDETNTGITGSLATVGTGAGQVSSGAGWHYDVAGGFVRVTASDAVLSGLLIPYNVDIEGSSGNVLDGIVISNCEIVTGGGSSNIISVRWTTNLTIEDCTIHGINVGSGRAGQGIANAAGNNPGLVVQRCNMYWIRAAIAMGQGLIQDNYIHDPGFITGDHIDGMVADGPCDFVTRHNTILINMDQTSPLDFASNDTDGMFSGATIDGNLLAGGGYAAYLGNAGSYLAAHPTAKTADVVFTNNVISRRFYPNGGTFGPYVYFDATGPGNVFSGNTWYETGLPVT
jgi:hypothetical protein